KVLLGRIRTTQETPPSRGCGPEQRTATGAGRDDVDPEAVCLEATGRATARLDLESGRSRGALRALRLPARRHASPWRLAITRRVRGRGAGRRRRASPNRREPPTHPRKRTRA